MIWECVIDIAGILGAIISIPTAIFTCINNFKLQKADAKLKKELQAEDSALKTELKKADSDLKKELQEADATLKKELQEADGILKKELQEADHNFEREILLLKQEFAAIPLVNEQKQQSNEIIFNYMEMIQKILDTDRKDDNFNAIQNKVLVFVPESLHDEIKQLNKHINDYFLFKDPLYKDHIYELYNKSLKEKLSTHIQRPTTVSFARHDGSRSSYSLAARKPKSVTDSEMPKENVQGLRQEVEDFN